MKTRCSLRLAAFWLPTFLVVPLAALYAATAWTPMTPEEAAQTDSRIEPGASAEIIALRVSIDDTDGLYAEYKYHLRVKLFSAKGVEDFLSHKIEYDGKTSVSGIEARTYKPDGTVLILDKKSILDQQVIRTDDTRIRAKVVALPGLEPGCVVELRWTEEHENIAIVRMVFQDRHPARLIHYDFRAYEDIGLESFAVNYRGPIPKLDSRGRYQLEMADIKSYKDEPYDPPDVQSKSWLVAWYTRDRAPTVEKYWQNYCKLLDDRREARARSRKDATDAAKQATAGAATDDEKLRRLYEFCVTKIKNQSFGYAGYTAEQRKKLKRNESVSDTLKNGYGTGEDINHLFIAMARGLGLEACLAMVGDRDSFVPSIKSRQGILLRDPMVAVAQGATWLFLDPGSIFLPYGMLRPENEGVLAVLSDPKKTVHAITPMTPADLSLKRRVAHLALSAEGDLTGAVTIDYTGLRAFETKYDLEDETVEHRHDSIRKEVTGGLPLAEVTDISIDGVDSPTQPLKVSYKLRVPQFADRTGQRLLFQPAVFQKGRLAYFTAEKRENRISFRRSQSTYDEIHLELPPGFKLEEASAPAPLIDLGPFGKYRTQLSTTKTGTGLVYQRELAQRFATVAPEHYAEIKRVFDILHTQDNHTLSLLETAAPAAPGGNSAR